MMFYFSSKSAARGFRNFQNYRPAILFHCGRLDLLPRPEIASATLFQEEPELVMIAVETALSSYGVGPPPAQIRTGSATASGSCLGFWRRSAHRAMGDTNARQESTGSASGASVSRSLRLAVLGVAMPGATAAQPDPGMSGAAFHCRGLRGTT